MTFPVPTVAQLRASNRDSGSNGGNIPGVAESEGEALTVLTRRPLAATGAGRALPLRLLVVLKFQFAYSKMYTNVVRFPLVYV